MKAVLQALNSITVAFGNAIDLIIISATSSGGIFTRQVLLLISILRIYHISWQSYSLTGIWVFPLCWFDCSWYVYSCIYGHQIQICWLFWKNQLKGQLFWRWAVISLWFTSSKLLSQKLFVIIDTLLHTNLVIVCY